MNLSKLLSILILCFYCFNINAQQGWQNQFNEVFFIENKGQIKPIEGEKVKFHAFKGGSEVYFLPSGIVFRRADLTAEEIHERKEAREKGLSSDPIKYISEKISFQNRSQQLTISGQELQSHYYTFSWSSSIKSQTCKKLIYQNIYQNIDLVFYFPLSGGLKYDIILHPGANINDLGFKYESGNEFDINAKGLLTVNSPFGEFTDMAPKAVNNTTGADLKVNYSLTGDNIIKFDLDDYPKTHSVTIDPWLNVNVTFDQLPPIEVDYDYDGNTYASGKGTNATIVFLKKYSPTGMLEWTYAADGFLISPAAFTVNRTTESVFTHGESFGFGGGGNLFMKIGVAGNRLDSVDAQLNPNYDTLSSINENNRFEYDHCTDTVLIGSGSNIHAALLDTAFNDNIGKILFNPYDSSANIDAQMMRMDPYERSAYIFYGKSLFSFGVVPIHNNALVKVPLTTISPYTWLASTGYTFQEQGTAFNGQTNTHQVGNFYNGIAVGIDQVYTYNGYSIKTWNKTTGAVIDSVDVLTVANLADSASGIAADACGNVYVGIQDSIKCYSSTLNYLGNYAVPGVPYDLRLGDNNLLYACGDDFIEVIDLDQAFPTVHPLFTLSQTPDSCLLGTGTATVSGCSYLDTLSILWSTGQTTPTITGLSSGMYNVEVTVDSLKSCNGFSYTYVDSILVQDITVPCGFQLQLEDDTVCLGDCIDLLVTTLGNTGPVTYQWDNGIASTIDSVNVCPIVTTTYQVIGTDSIGEIDTAYATITVLNYPVVDLGNDTTICDTVHILDAGNPTYSHLWNDSSTNQTLTINTSGLYFVEVNNNGCIDIDSIQVNLIDINVDLGNDTSFCNGGSVLLDAGNPGLTYLWNDNSTNQTLNASTTGTYSVVVSDQGCSDSDAVNITVLPIPVVDLGNDTVVCSPPLILDAGNGGLGATYLWQDNSTNQTFTVNNTGTYYVTATLGTCEASDTILVTVPVFSVSLGLDDTICVDENLVLDAGNAGLGASYLWQDNSTNQTLAINTSGTYWVEVDVNGCVKSDTIDITVQTITAEFDPQYTDGCVPLHVNFTDQSSLNFGTVSSWVWDFGDGNIATNQNPVNTFDIAGLYDVSLRVLSNFGCADTVIKQSNVEGYPQAEAGFSHTPNIGIAEETVQFTNLSENATGWQWDLGDGTISIEENPIHIYQEAGTYTVTLIATNVHGCNDTVTYSLTVGEQILLFVPNAFTPDNDDFNQEWTFSVSGIDIYDFSLVLYNRWGEIVWESYDPSAGWDGTYNGDIVPNGVYIWKMEISSPIFDERQQFTGHVTVIR